jgi:hypothetical protein
MTRSGSQVVRNQPDSHDGEFGQVLRFPRHPKEPLFPISAARPGDPEPDSADDLARYQQEQDEHIDYRQRMLMNVIAAAIVALLVGAGVWIADSIAGMEKDQDCVMQGRTNCAPIEAPAPDRQ